MAERSLPPGAAARVPALAGVLYETVRLMAPSQESAPPWSEVDAPTRTAVSTDPVNIEARESFITLAEAALEHLIDITGGPHHVARFNDHDFTVQHPLAERLDGSLFDCAIHAAIADLPGPPAPGDHRVALDEHGELLILGPVRPRPTAALAEATD